MSTLGNQIALLEAETFEIDDLTAEDGWNIAGCTSTTSSACSTTSTCSCSTSSCCSTTSSSCSATSSCA
nr:hypothetical protein CYJ24_11630 [Actinomyces naeslundii]